MAQLPPDGLGAGAPPDDDRSPDGWAALPRPRVDAPRRFNVSLVWLVPLVALLVGASLLVRTVLLIGPRIEIEFNSAESIEPGRTEVRYKEVVIGRVETVQLRDDRTRVVVTVQLDRNAASIAVEDTTFWVVRPRVGTSGITGLGTLLSGAYIGVDAGVSRQERTHFKGLESPPFVLRGEPGSVFVLRADDLGSLDVGSPVYHRRTRVGRVVGYTLDPDRDELSIKIFVEAPYQKLVTTQTRFWNASGVDVTIGASGLTLDTQSLVSVLAGGLAFADPPDTPNGTPAAENSVFTLAGDRAEALAPPAGPPMPVRMVFDQSVRGLAPGAPIDFLGVEIGRVRQVSLQYDARRDRFPVEVTADIFPLRFGPIRSAASSGASGRADDEALIQNLVDHGLRAQLRTGNLLTGQLYVAFDFQPGRAPARVQRDAGLLTLPTVPGTLSEIQPQIADIVQKVSKIPFDQIGRDLQATLRGAQTTIAQLTPEAQKALAEVQRTLQKAQGTLDTLERGVLDPSAPLQRNVEDTMLELQRASRSLRTLADYLQMHPESLLRGKPPDPAIPSRGGSNR
ncbi:intermembrane transport protein PqiB [Piscinibacter koreensis]|uniref:MCE family protein n=1 Tax=Piscinibacter koreensis TaxID=2742824 RepID=A0A7Y6NL24_9BURK|nr:MlaD family protein [Schlegelella koreensis]NUZ05079.1 MCE family protein [Schlegelella koreensis]